MDQNHPGRLLSGTSDYHCDGGGTAHILIPSSRLLRVDFVVSGLWCTVLNLLSLLMTTLALS